MNDINRTAALENAETSAVGRALGMMGIGVVCSIATIDEINKSRIEDNRLKNEHLSVSNYVYMFKNRVARMGAKSLEDARRIISRNSVSQLLTLMI